MNKNNTKQFPMSNFQCPTWYPGKPGLIIFIIFLWSLVIGHWSFAAEPLRFYGEEIVVTAIRLPIQKELSPWSTAVLRPSDFKTTLTDSLRDVSGADVKSNGYLGSVGTARLRGSTSQQVLLLKDGVRLNSPLLGLSDFSDQLLYNAERVEIVKAPLSSIYGSDAIGGVVNIITKRDLSPKLGLDVALGSFNTNKDTFYVTTNLFGLNSQTYLNYILTSGFRQNSDYSARSASQKFTWEQYGKWQAYLDYYSAKKGVPNVPNSQADPYSASTPFNRQEDENLLLDVNLENEIGPVNQNIRLSSNNMFQKFHQYNFFSANFEDTAYRSNQSAIELAQNIGPYLYGLEGRADQGESDYAGNHRVNNYAGFAQGNFSNGPLSLIVGARLDKHSVVGYSLNPRIGAAYLLPNDLILRGSAGTAFKAPTLNDLYWNDPIWQMYGNQNLSPEKSQSVDLGVEKKISDNSTVTLDYYRTSITDLIMWDWDIATNITQAKNVGAVETFGYELEYKTRFTQALSSFINAAYQDVQDTKDITPGYIGKTVPYSPKLKYSLGINVYENIKIVLRYVGERYADSGNTIKIPEYTLVDLNLKKDCGPYYMGLTIDNLFNQVYYESAGYHPVTYAHLFYPMPGRRFTVSFGGSI